MISTTTKPAAYESRPINRERRNRKSIDSIKQGIRTVLEEIATATVRQLYFQLVSRGLIAKTEAEYEIIEAAEASEKQWLDALAERGVA